MNELEFFLLKLHLCNLDLKNELRVVRYMLSFERCPSKDELFLLLKLGQTQKNDLWNALQSKQLSQKIQQNLKVSHFLTILDKRYPSQLQEIYSPPVVLFYQGDLELLDSKKLLGVVGARQCSSYALQALTQLLPNVIQQKLILVSGLAKGVDGLSHQLALKHHGKTIAVIGNGLDISYPSCNRALQTQIAHAGLLLSEYPLESRPLKYHFPLRNRIIAGLCQTVLVVEARHHSGSLITANLALQENRNVLALPGRINDIYSTGCNELIAAGAKPVLNSNDILEEFI
ncbi:DNA-processing protein DprA [Ligilactobacillus murinus]|jgi:DNA protecting protein DprA|uniref:DNA-protecting protein DprA n=2 Tax=Ligilactobacillus murinus TaxID=1622 RepID=A0A2Z4VZN9_9LACO|nr:DNA-processing protein DprA [Ligilactobacillus murinus]NBH85649.1 DNA-protecting protein DprA [Lachnospiraceae bacterium]HAB49215.1 DNA-protecting protein DprA [Lactobacillus sp.]AWZ38034.1 DNA-protecting protein DprA [Ligilactobacillus murinus]AWZ40975.1 DNA-protecting protein DprA [Ligilactobacillus murinus]KRM76776.1 DNA processing protein [Ligilactobacillus murinus DSM 20452 = NBRC 14221]